MSANVRVDQREFDVWLQKSLRYTKRTLAEVLNKKALYIARGALKLTHKASRAEVLATIGATEVTVGKSGRQLKRAKVDYSGIGPQFRGYYAAYLRRKGINPRSLSSQAFAEGARKYAGLRLRSIGYLASGWIPAIRKLGPIVHEQTKIAGARQFGKAKGSARPARDSFSPSVEIENAVLTHIKEADRPTAFVMRGMEAAFAAEIASMKKFVEEQIAKGF